MGAKSGSVLALISSGLIQFSQINLNKIQYSPFCLFVYKSSSRGHLPPPPVAFNLCSASPLHPACRLPATDKVSWQPLRVPSFAVLSGNPGSRVRATLLEQ